MSEITHVSDTALWVAYYRAMESERADALFTDPYARRLAGPKGEAIVRAMPRGASYAWPMIVRTKVMDEIILRTIGGGLTDTVLNLAAGLDTRAFRLDLPRTLRWVDVDFPDMIAYRSAGLQGIASVCQYETVALDLANVEARRALFQQVSARSNGVLVVSEGLLVYLSRDQVDDLADDLSAQPQFGRWLFDLASPFVLKVMTRTWGRRLTSSGLKFQFGPKEGPAFFEPHGWRVGERRSIWGESLRLQRTMPSVWFWKFLGQIVPPLGRAWNNFTSIVLLERSASRRPD
jgi:methyltransferase (TIGR00027 family)